MAFEALSEDTQIPHCLCDKPGKRILWHQEPGLRYVRCQTCGLIVRDPAPNMSQMSQEFYEGAYWGQPPECYVEHQRQHTRDIIQCLTALLGNHYHGTIRVLDVGCGLGVFLEEARGVGWDISGLEPSSYPACYVEEKLGITVERRFLEQADYSDNAFDVVYMNNALEHVADPVRTLRQVYRILRPGGLFYVEVPMETRRANFAIVALTRLLNRPFYPDRPGSFFDMAHAYIFNQKTLSRALHLTGFEVIDRRIEGWGTRWIDTNPSLLTRILRLGLIIHNIDVALLGFGYLMIWARKNYP